MGMKITTEKRQALCEYYVEAGCSINEAARKFGINGRTAGYILKQAGIPMNAINFKYKQEADDPTPAEIRAGCERALANRRPIQEKPYELPVYGSYCGKGGARIFQEVG